MVRYWASQAVGLCRDIEDAELEEYAEPVREAEQALQRDRRIVLIGGKQSGKSTLLAAMLGVGAIARHEMEGRYVCWRYTCRDGDATCSRFLPLPHLDGLELVDTADCADEGTQEVCLALLQGADVVIGVVDGREPDKSPVWDVLSRVPNQTLSTCLLAVTHTDLLGAAQGLRLKETLRDMCHERVRYPLPPYYVCPVDARGVESFCYRVQEALHTSHGLRAVIRSLADRAADLVDKQSRILRVRRTASLTDNSFISGIDQQIDNILSHQMKHIDMHRQSMNDALMQVLPPLLQRVRKYFGRGLSPTTLLRLELLGADTDRALYRQMEEAVQEMQSESDRQFAHMCSRHWNTVRPEMKASIECEIGDFPQEELERDLQDLRKRLCSDMYEPLATTGVRHRLFNLFFAQAGWMQACLVFICFLLTAGGALGFAGLNVPAVCCVVSAALVWLGGTVGSKVACHHICNEVAQITDELREQMKLSMRGVLERLIHSRVAAYRRLYTAPRQKVMRQNEMLEPLQQRQKEIYLHLRTIMPRL